MKKSVLFLTVIFLVLIGSSFQLMTGQDKTKEEKENEVKILQAIEGQKKAITEQKKKQEEFDEQELQKELKRDLENSRLELEEGLKDIQVIIKDAKDSDRFVRINKSRGIRSFPTDEPFIVSHGDNPFYGFNFGSDYGKTTWNFSKSLKECTSSHKYSFDVEKSAKTVIVSIMGDCEEGEVRVKIVMPGGKNYSDAVIDESGNLNWRKSFTISETENQDKTGEWKFEIISTKATGYFKISLQTY